MIRLVLLTNILVGVLIICLVSARRIGATNLTASQTTLAVLRPDACARPCWNGITPGKTMLERAEVLLNSDRTVSVLPATESSYTARLICWNVHSWTGCAIRPGYAGLFGPIIMVELNPPLGSLTLGEAVLLLGEPEAGTLCVRSVTGSQVNITASVYFSGGLEVDADYPLQPSTPRFDPNMVVSAVRYNEVDNALPYRFDTPKWHGFGGYAALQGC